MSIALMTAAFRTKIPTTQKFVFVALCDNANDQGECYPSVQMICEKTSLKDRAVRSAFKWLVDHGFMIAEHRKGSSNYFYISSPETWNYEPEVIHNPCTKCSPAPDAPLHDMQDSPAPDAGLPLHNMHTPPAYYAPITINEPSIEPSVNHQEARAPAKYSPEWLTKEGVPLDVASAFASVREAKKAPLTFLAIQALKREAAKAGISLADAVRFAAENGYQSFQAKYLHGRPQQASVYDDTMAAAQRAKALIFGGAQ